MLNAELNLAQFTVASDQEHLRFIGVALIVDQVQMDIAEL